MDRRTVVVFVLADAAADAASALGVLDNVNCAKFEDTIMPDGERWTGTANLLPEKYRVR